MYVIETSAWVSVKIEFKSWPNFDLMFPSATYCLLWSILVVLHSQLSSLLLWFVAYCIDTSALHIHVCVLFLWWHYMSANQQKKDKHLTINSGLGAIKNKSFPCRNILIGVICSSRNLKEYFFFEERAFYHVNQQIM